jgi:metal-dependent amidase/aminoacylase/carboxypeptidase family protein
MTHDIDPVAVRQRLHRHPEPFWREFHTTSIIVEELERVGVDEVHVGRAALAADERLGVPDEATLEKWQERAERAGAREDVLEATAGGATGVVARVDRGDGPTVGLHVDIDGVTTPVRRAPFGSGEDAAWLMHAARKNGGEATHLIVGTDHPSGHHTPTVDVDEASLNIGTEVVARAVRAVDRGARDGR